MNPILFLIYINDFCNAVQSEEQILFADDATYYDYDDDFNTVLNRINTNLKQLHQWFLANKLLVNIIKTEAMIFTRKNIYYPQLPIMLLNEPLPYNFSF